jgi:RHS repeat-associated protein
VGNEAQTEAGAFTTAVTRYYYFGSKRVAMRGPDDAVVWLHGDHLGSTSLATDAAQAVVSRQLYYPFGEQRWASAELPTDFQFTGQRIQSTIALYDYHARFYDPYVGRFIQADSIVPSPGNPQHFNRYAYVLNNPLGFTDPSGHKDCGPACESDWTTHDINFGSAYYGPWDLAAQARNRAKIELVVAIFDAVAALVNEPYDWATTSARCSQGGCNALDYAGFLPFIPGILGRLDEVGDAARAVNKLDEASGVVRAADKVEDTSDVLRAADRLDNATRIRALRSRPFAQSSELNRRVIEQMYRGEWVGDVWKSADGYAGGLAGAVRRQLATDELVGGKDHIQKAWERLAQLKDILRTGTVGSDTLDSGDMEIVRALHDDLQAALQGN